MISSRMCSGTNNVLALPSGFIDNLIGTSVPQWKQQMEQCAIDVFKYNMIIVPFHHDGNKSLFVVMGAKHIKDYMKAEFHDTRPCILHVLPYAASMQSHSHAYNKATTRLRVWLNALWRMMRCNNDFDIASMPFTHRSLPVTRPVGMCMFYDTEICYHSHASSHFKSSVPCPAQNSDVGICLLKYASCISSTDAAAFSKHSFDDDGHEQCISDLPSLDICPSVLNQLRLNVLKLVCEVTCKYQSVRKKGPLNNNAVNQALPYGTNNSGSQHGDDQTDSPSIGTSSTWKSCGSMPSNSTDSTYHPLCDDEDEHDDMCSIQDGGNQNDISDCEDAHSVVQTDVEDDSSVDEMYSDFKTNNARCGNDVGDASDSTDDTDNLVCPGDVLEYVTIDGDQAARRSTVDTVIEGGSETRIVMKDGTILRPKMYSVRKVKFYDGCNQELIPNPLAQWHRLDKCILQSVISINHLRPGDLIEYRTVASHNQTVSQSSIVTIGGDSKASSYIILKNGIVLQPNKHSLRKIELYDEFKQMLIPNPLADWYRLEKYILSPGSVQLDEETEHDEFDKLDQTDTAAARAERRRKNKQR